MTGLAMLLKTFGVKVSEEDIRKVEILIPQIPSVITNAITVINDTIKQADARFLALETSMVKLQDQNAALMIAITELKGSIHATNGEHTATDRNGIGTRRSGSVKRIAEHTGN